MRPLFYSLFDKQCFKTNKLEQDNHTSKRPNLDKIIAPQCMYISIYLYIYLYIYIYIYIYICAHACELRKGTRGPVEKRQIKGRVFAKFLPPQKTPNKQLGGRKFSGSTRTHLGALSVEEANPLKPLFL